MKEQELTQTTAVFKALSDPNRLRIFAELMSGDSCNYELKDNLGLAPNLLSHHLKVLESVSLVQSRRDVVDGRWIYYSVNQAAAAHWRSWFTHFLDPTRIQERPVCGPERDLIVADQVAGGSG